MKSDLETNNLPSSYRAYNQRAKILMSEVPFTANQNIMQSLLKAKEIKELGKQYFVIIF